MNNCERGIQRVPLYSDKKFLTIMKKIKVRVFIVIDVIVIFSRLKKKMKSASVWVSSQTATENLSQIIGWATCLIVFYMSYY